MTDLISYILNKDFDAARQSLDEAMDDIIEHKLAEMKKTIDLTEGWYKKNLDSASKKSDIWGNWDSSARGGRGDFSEKGKKELTTGEKVADKIDNTKIAVGKAFRHSPVGKGLRAYGKWLNKQITKEETIEEGRHKGIRNRKKGGSLAAQTRDLRNTFGVAPGKRRRAGPRASLEEDIRGFIQAARNAGKDVKRDFKQNIMPDVKAASKRMGNTLRNDILPTSKAAIKNALAEGKLKNKAIEFEEKHGRKMTNNDLKKEANRLERGKGKLKFNAAKGQYEYDFSGLKKKLEEVAKWRKTSAKVETGNDDYPGNDYGGKWKSTADTPTKWGSISDRKPGKLRKDGKPLAKTISGLKARIKANLGKEE